MTLVTSLTLVNLLLVLLFPGELLAGGLMLVPCCALQLFGMVAELGFSAKLLVAPVSMLLILSLGGAFLLTYLVERGETWAYVPACGLLILDGLFSGIMLHSLMDVSVKLLLLALMVALYQADSCMARAQALLKGLDRVAGEASPEVRGAPHHPCPEAKCA